LVVTADDIPGDNVVQLIGDQAVLAPQRGEIRHKEEPILLLAAADRGTLRRRRGTSRSTSSTCLQSMRSRGTGFSPPSNQGKARFWRSERMSR